MYKLKCCIFEWQQCIQAIFVYKCNNAVIFVSIQIKVVISLKNVKIKKTIVFTLRSLIMMLIWMQCIWNLNLVVLALWHSAVSWLFLVSVCSCWPQFSKYSCVIHPLNRNAWIHCRSSLQGRKCWFASYIARVCFNLLFILFHLFYLLKKLVCVCWMQISP